MLCCIFALLIVVPIFDLLEVRRNDKQREWAVRSLLRSSEETFRNAERSQIELRSKIEQVSARVVRIEKLIRQTHRR
jgi:hypothetical protein